MIRPRVSVLTPIYNTNPMHLKECIESILSQTFQDFEFIILNDSPDNVELDELVKSYDDKRIVYLKNEKNIGITKSRNKLLDLAKGEYIAIFDHDDISLPQRLEKEVAFLDANPNVGVVSGWTEWFGFKKFIMKSPESDIDIRVMMTNDNYIIHTACMIRKSVLEQHNLQYNEDYSPSEDYKLCSELMDVTDFYNIPEVLVKYRKHNNNTSKKQKARMQNVAKKIRLEISEKYPAYRHEFENKYQKKKIKLFGFIPFLTIVPKRNKKIVSLWNIFPLFKIS